MTLLRPARSIGAILIGYLIFALSAVALFQGSGREPHAPQPTWFMTLSTLFGMVFAGIGGWVATKIAPSHPQRHAAAVAVLLGLGAGVSLLTSPAVDATWSQWAALLFMAPSAYLGGHRATSRGNHAPRP
jgi:peptidoglycan/LPS O-acetylase OafA/YrhL